MTLVYAVLCVIPYYISDYLIDEGGRSTNLLVCECVNDSMCVCVCVNVCLSLVKSMYKLDYQKWPTTDSSIDSARLISANLFSTLPDWTNYNISEYYRLYLSRWFETLRKSSCWINNDEKHHQLGETIKPNAANSWPNIPGIRGESVETLRGL